MPGKDKKLPLGVTLKTVSTSTQTHASMTLRSNKAVKSLKNNYLMKSEVGMAVLKSKQTRVVGVISTYV